MNGEVQFTLQQGDYRFRSDLNGTHFWSGETNHCTIPGCLNASITVTVPLTVTVQSQTSSPYPDLPVYAFSGESYTGFNGTSDENGQVIFTLPVGDYRFRSDYDGVQFWSGEVNHCTIPGCLEVLVEIPGRAGEVSVTIDYTYDPLYRLTSADYSTGKYFYYTYDAVGNRLTQETHEGFNTYVYDIANRLIEVDGIVYIWDDNGNLLDDGISLYTYDRADRLSSVFQGSDTYLFLYNDLGDRLSQTVNGVPTNYTLNIARGLTQVLTDDTSAYLYGLQRIGEVGGIDWSYYQGDAIGSMRQLIDSNSDATMAQSFAPFGAILSITGDETTNYGFAGEWTDATSLVNLRARYYAPTQGRFLQRDTWSGDVETPQTINQFPYVFNNPISLTDPSGNCPWCWILIVLGFATACSIPGPDQISPEMVLRSSVGFQLFGEKDHMPSIGTYLGDGKFITHDHFDREGFKRIHEERGMNIYNAFGQGIAYVPSEQVTLLEVDRHAYAIYKVAGGVLESSALVPATIGNNNLVRENRIGVGVRWSGVPGADVPLEVFEGRIAELIGQITNLSANFIVGAITERGDSGAGFWVGTKLVGVLRAGIMERTRYHYASP